MNKGRITSISSGDLGSAKINFNNKKILIIGRRGTGKSSLCEAIIKKVIDNGAPNKAIIISPTEKNSKFYTDKFYCDVRYRLGNIDDIIYDMQDRRSLLVIDDSLNSIKLDKKVYESLEYMICEMDNLTLVATVQYAFFTRELLTLFDYIFIGSDDYVTNIKKMYDNIPTGIESFLDFNRMMMGLPNFNFLMVDIKKQIDRSEGENEHTNFPLNNFEIDKIDFGGNESILIINNSERDNCRIIRNLMYGFKDLIDEVIVMNASGRNLHTESIDKAYGTNSNVLDYVLSEKNLHKRKLLVVENCISKLARDQQFTEVLLNSGHYNTTLIVVERFPVSIGPEIRINFDRCIIGRYNEKPELQKLYDHYFGMLQHNSDLKQLMKYANSDHFLMVANRSRDGALSLFTVNDKYHTTNQYSGNIIMSETDDMTHKGEANTADNSCKVPLICTSIDLAQVMAYLKQLDNKVDKIARKLE
jgi:GTPase SAR1 family protein